MGMSRERFLTLFRCPPFVLSLILFVFFLKGVFLGAIQPLFVGQDETRHYNTAQYLAEPEDAISAAQIIKKKNYDGARNKDDFSTYNFSQEIQKTAEAVDNDALRGNIFNTTHFSQTSVGRNESIINSKIWKPYNYYSDPDVAGTSSLYHKLAAQIEKLFASQSILVRFYLLRIFSVLLGTVALYFCYRTAQTIGFAPRTSLILTALVAFQPKFSLYFTNINYDVLLIPMFFLFTYAGVHALTYGLGRKNLSLLITSIVIATQTKATGYILIVVFATLIAYLLHEKIKQQQRYFQYGIYSISFLMILLIISYLYSTFLSNDLSQHKIIDTLSAYLSKTITYSRFVLPSDTYWGTLSWTNSWAVNNTMTFIFYLESIALFGLGILLFSKKFHHQYPSFLPEKKYLLFLIGMIIALQLGVRAADWSAFSRLGDMSLSLGTPGRYFLPNLSAHMLVMAAGLGALLAFVKQEKYFNPLLIGILILMFSLTTYLTFNAIILRFYL